MNWDAFIKTWEKTGASERANFQPFMIDLISRLDLDAVAGATADKKGDDYAFERPVKNRISGQANFIDLYRRGCFVMEGKQGSDKIAKPKNTLQYELMTGQSVPKDQRVGTAKRGTAAWVTEMMKARQQAERYAHSLETDQGLPPFIIIVDVGYVIELYADFSGQGKYEQFPNKKDHQIYLKDLKDESVRDRLRAIWTDPQSLDASQYAAKVTREVAIELAELGKSYPPEQYPPEKVAKFLMRCLFTMFAEDVDLIPRLSFENLLKDMRDSGNHKSVAPMLEELWSKMDKGGFSVSVRADLMRFNGGLFRAEKGGSIPALPVNEVQLSLLIRAAEKDWKHVEPSIFGTLLERALSPKARHKLGAHYTPRPYVERLVGPTIMEPLRADFEAVTAAAVARLEKEDPDGARRLVKDFHHTLCTTRVLDPACGSGNFLYVAMERMKRLEADVLKLLEDLGEKEPRLMLQGETIDPHQFLGLEINEWAVWAAELVLWIGYLQWHFKTFGKAAPSEPVLKDFHNIEKRDALLTWESTELHRNDDGEIVTRWDGESYIASNITGEFVRDSLGRKEVYNYKNPRTSKWPDADFIIGNPPFIGNKRMRSDLGDGYVDALNSVYGKALSNADFVMYWWFIAATNMKNSERLKRFGFISTDSIRMISNRQILSSFLSDKKKPLSITYAINNHPWVSSSDGAAVEIAMTVAMKGSHLGRLETITEAIRSKVDETYFEIEVESLSGKIQSNLMTGANIDSALPLTANQFLSWMGIIPNGIKAFTIGKETAQKWGYNAPYNSVIKPYLGGTALKNGRSPNLIIDLNGISLNELQAKHTFIYNHLLEHIYQDRKNTRRKKVRENWWLFEETRPGLRSSIQNLQRYIATVETTKHRAFSFVDSNILPDQKLRVIASNDAIILTLVSSTFHQTWAISTGGDLGPTPVYNNTVCFDPFPFPDLDNQPDLKIHLRDLGERLDTHRKDRQAEHPKLTLTQMYNVLEKVRAGDVIEGKDKQIYDDGLIGILKQIHDEIDAATAQAYGWPGDLSDEEILKRLVALNKERALEEAKGHIRWLRPEYQNPDGHAGKAKTSELDLSEPSLPDAAAWPKTLPEQMGLVRGALREAGTASIEDIRSQFKNARAATVRERLETLAALGQAEILPDGRFAA